MLPAAAIILVLVAPQPAIASTIFTTGGADSADFSTSDSNPTSGSALWTAGSFSVTGNVVLRSVTFNGLASGSVPPSQFSIAIFPDDGGNTTSPGFPNSPDTSNPVLSPTGLVLFSVVGNQFNADLPVNVPLGPGNYWVSIADNTPDAGFTFGMQNAGSAGIRVVTSSISQESGYVFRSASRTIGVQGSDERFNPNVPEPGVATLLALSSLGACLRRRRRVS